MASLARIRLAVPTPAANRVLLNSRERSKQEGLRNLASGAIAAIMGVFLMTYSRPGMTFTQLFSLGSMTEAQRGLHRSCCRSRVWTLTARFVEDPNGLPLSFKLHSQCCSEFELCTTLVLCSRAWDFAFLSIWARAKLRIRQECVGSQCMLRCLLPSDS